jgi:hypothetical protein
MQYPLIRLFDIGQWLQSETQSAHLVGREVARHCRDAIEQQLDTTADGTVTTLDCASIDHLDYAAADECFVRLIQRLQAMEYGDQFLILAGLTPTQEDNLTVALERKKIATLIQRKDGPEIIGHLNPYLLDAYGLIKKERAATARDWADATGDDISLGSTKMLTLHKMRLVKRESHRMPDGGRQFVYSLVQGIMHGGIDRDQR